MVVWRRGQFLRVRWEVPSFLWGEVRKELVSGLCFHGKRTHRRQGFTVQSNTSFFFNINVLSWEDCSHFPSPHFSIHSSLLPSFPSLNLYLQILTEHVPCPGHGYWDPAMNKTDWFLISRSDSLAGSLISAWPLKVAAVTFEAKYHSFIH